MNLPIPICELGYPDKQLREIFTREKYQEFFHWMSGQTFSVCDGSTYDHRQKRTVPSGCGPHGYVYYAWDVQRFLDGGPIVD